MARGCEAARRPVRSTCAHAYQRPWYSSSILIRAHTAIASPHACPEIRLHLVTPACPLWTAREADLERLGLTDPFWAFCWAGGQALARHVLDNPSIVRGRSVLDFGAGGGVVGIAAALAGARRVIAADIDPIAIEAIRENAALNGVELEVTAEDLVGRPLEGIDVLLAGDVCYDGDFAARAIAWFADLTSAGIRVLAGDPGRGHAQRAAPLHRIASYLAPSDIDSADLRETTVYEVQRSPPRSAV